MSVTAQHDTRTFRMRLLDVWYALDGAKHPLDSRIWDLEAHGGGLIGPCPCCRARPPEYLSIRFRGETDVATLYCSAGCTEEEVAAAFRRHPAWSR